MNRPGWPALRGVPLVPQIDSPRVREIEVRRAVVLTRVRQAWVVEVQRPDGSWSPVRACDRKAEALAAPGAAR